MNRIGKGFILMPGSHDDAIAVGWRIRTHVLFVNDVMNALTVGSPSTNVNGTRIEQSARELGNRISVLKSRVPRQE